MTLQQAARGAARSRARINGPGISECWWNHFVTFQLGLCCCCLCTEMVWVGGNGTEYSLFSSQSGLGAVYIHR